MGMIRIIAGVALLAPWAITRCPVLLGAANLTAGIGDCISGITLGSAIHITLGLLILYWWRNSRRRRRAAAVPGARSRALRDRLVTTMRQRTTPAPA